MLGLVKDKAQKNMAILGLSTLKPKSTPTEETNPLMAALGGGAFKEDKKEV